MSDTPATPARAVNPVRRRRTLWLFVLLLLLAGAGVLAWWALVLRYEASTDDAYVDGFVSQVNSRIPGVVTAVYVNDTDRVVAGELLARLDDSDARIALGKAESALARAVQGAGSSRADVEQAVANVRAREAQLALAKSDLARRRVAAGGDAVPAEAVAHAEQGVQVADAELAAARAALASARSQAAAGAVRDYPAVREAADAVREAWLNRARTEIRAPIAGLIAKRSVTAGTEVAPGTPLMAIVPLGSVWVNANFKETQLANLRVGQPVSLTADAYGSGVSYHGRVAGLAAGTGSVFSLLPPENANGNWIKVVQRLPVRVVLERADLEKHPLQVGLSIYATVDTRERGGARLAPLAASPRQAVSQTGVYAAQLAGADARIEAIIADALQQKGRAQ
ncbi:efflux RND transporter periplasmic adaptor subunit [Crenobacter caeni]|uniref:HlyD family efflux transporter periplasmic adaptor subunit n=1 Tax=Crenobacter caeni TaxID=2705474 RepID=A0A6B2KRT3_9NEIS|nr:efflux RND transporter periplasmic adaptor subunit [Crenobacter caeni]NDV12952.1 HlyD family efflux transporter periplasmic adaptor subunit [Crenobacter caeni]